MKHTHSNHYMTGISIPIFSLRSERSCGTGEFLDLIPLANWCKTNEMDIIQILPVHDTGNNPTPFEPLSAFALNPMYINLSNVTGADNFYFEINSLTEKLQNAKILKYKTVLKKKISLLKEIYEANQIPHTKYTELREYIKKNPWIKPYAAYKVLSQKFYIDDWSKWPEHRHPEPEDIEKIWNSSSYRDVHFITWVQLELEKQLIQAKEYIEKQGLELKVEVPIFLSKNGSDTWYYRELFKSNVYAGAPPDKDNPEGQIWEYPVFNWPAFKEDNFNWIKNRIKHYEKFFTGVRINHIMGFFRFWCNQNQNISSKQGYYYPIKTISQKDLRNAGFNDSRINWLCHPHIYSHEIYGTIGNEAENVIKLAFNQIGKEDLFLFKPFIKGALSIKNLPIDQKAKDFLINCFNNRTFLEIKRGEFTSKWNYSDTRAYQSLSEEEKQSLDDLIQNSWQESEKLWKKSGEQLLLTVLQLTSLKIYAEDLGPMPNSVPEVLNQLKIPSLKIFRWMKDFSATPPRAIPPEEFPLLSVCSSSHHNTSTLRGWIKTHKNEFDPNKPTFEKIRDLLVHQLKANSHLFLIPIQDILDLDPEKEESPPELERINTPGTHGDHNWSYRMPITIEQMLNKERLFTPLKDAILERKKMALPEDMD